MFYTNLSLYTGFLQSFILPWSPFVPVEFDAEIICQY